MTGMSVEGFARHARPEQARLLRALNLDVVYRSAERDTLYLDASIVGSNKVLDLVGGHGAALFGHNHPRLIAIAEDCLRKRAPFSAQASVRAGAGRLAERLSAMIGSATGAEYVVTFGSTGADAVEAAVKHATVARSRHLASVQHELEKSLRRARRDGADRAAVEIDGVTHAVGDVVAESIDAVRRMRETESVFVSLAGAFHGKTYAAAALTDRTNTPADLLAPGPRRLRVSTWDPAEVITAFDAERIPFWRISIDESGAPTAILDHISRIAACFAEPIQGEGGVREVPDETLRALRELADRHGAALVFDEIQSGMGRTGPFLASSPSGVAADCYLLSKSLGGGLAKISAMLVASDTYVADFGRYHTSTFADDDFSAAIAEAALDLLHDNHSQFSAAGVEIKNRLIALAARWPDVFTEVRGRGLLLGIELRPPSPASQVLAELVHPDLFGYIVAGHLLHVHGVRVMPTLSAPTTLRIQPSGFIEIGEIDLAIAAFDATAALIRRGEYGTLLAHLAEPSTSQWYPPQPISAPRPSTSDQVRPWGSPPRVAFLANLREAGDLRELAPELSAWSDDRCRALFDRARGVLEPFEITRELVESPAGGTVEVCVIGVPVSAAQVVEGQRTGHGAWLRGLVLGAVDYAIGLGAGVVGLGGYTSIVTNASRDVVEDSVRVTSGNSLTAACAYQLLVDELNALPAGERSVGVVGALGNIGAVMAELLAPYCDSMVLVGRAGSASRLRRVAERLPDNVVVAENAAALRDCRVVVTATNSATPIIDASHVHADRSVLVCDLAVPGDVDPRLADSPNVTLVSGGRMLLPANQTPKFPGTGLPPGVVYACMAEAILLGFEPATPSPSFGALTVAGVLAARDLAARHDLVPVRTSSGTPTATHRPMFLGGPDFRTDTAGGKAATLHELAAAGFDVPPGFVVEATTDLDDVGDDELQRWIDTLGGFPVAVRSSGTYEDLDDASFAGQYESYLDVTDITALRSRVADCRASVHNDRVRTYLSRKGFDPSKADVAVLVQRLVDARTAGVGFSIDPLSGIEEQAVLECCRGLGERLVSGHVTPARFTVRLDDGSIVEHVEGSEPVEFSDAEAAALAALLLRVQAFRHRPQDIEWAIGTDGRQWLLQSRAITSIAWRTDIGQFSDADLRDGGVSARVCTPLMFSLYDNAFQASMQRFWGSLKLVDAGDERDWMAMYYGRPYWNVSAVKQSYNRIPGYNEQVFDDDLGVIAEYGEAGPARTPTNVATIGRALPVALALRKSVRNQLGEVDRFAADWPAKHQAWRERVARLPRTGEPAFVADLADCLLTFHATTERAYFTTIYHNSSVQSDFKTMLAKVDAATGNRTAIVDLIGGLGAVSHMEMQRGIVDLYRVAVAEGFGGPAWTRARGEFLDVHGFHADAELDLTCPRWSEVPERIDATVAAMIDAGNPPADPAVSLTEQGKRLDAELTSVRRRIRSNPMLRVRYGRAFGKHVERARRYLVARERMREFSSQAYAIVRAYVLEAGVRFAADGALAAPDDVFMLTLHEIVDLARGTRGPGLAAAIAYRRAMYDGYRELSPPHELGGVTAAAPAGDGLSGLGCSPGVVEGTARVLGSLAEIDQLRKGDILVTRFTDPGWTPALGLVAGVVTEVGGALSHAAVIGREYGIPAVLNIAGVTDKVRSGQRIRVDGSNGVVVILDPAIEPGNPPAPQEAEPVTVTGLGTTVTTRAPKETEKPLTERKRLICIAGGDGSGKTTQVARIAAAFEAQGQVVAPVTIWDPFLDPTVSSKLPFKPAHIYAYLKMLTPLSRTHFLFHAMQLALDLASQRGADVILANAYWYKYFATEVAHGGNPTVLRQLAAGFPEPDRTFHLAISPQEALARKQQRSDYESGYGDEQEFLAFQRRSHDAIGELSTEFGWIELDGTAPPADLTATILEQLREDDR